MIFRPANQTDMLEITGQTRRETCHALVAEDDGKRMAIFGIYPMSTRWVIFAWATDEFRANKRAVIASIKAMKELLASRPKMPLLAHADPKINGSDVLLKHTGFESLGKGYYQCLGNKPSPLFSR